MNETRRIPEFKTIRQAAKTGLISERQLRLRVAQSRCPGVYAGSRFMVNFDALIDQLERESLQAASAWEYSGRQMEMERTREWTLFVR